MTLTAHNISVRIKDKMLIEDISILIEPGQLVVIIGPNGAGKSTLMRALAGDIKPQCGEVRMGNRLLTNWSTREVARVRAVLPQNSTLTFPFTVLQVVLMGRNPHIKGIESVQDYAIVRKALETAQIDHLENRIYTSLSGGERQRVQLARVISQIWETGAGQRYLLLDEPTNSLDLTHQHATLDLARKFAEQGVAVLAVLHDLNLAAQYADKIVLLHRGKHVITGTPTQVLTMEIIESVFDIPVMITDHPHLSCPLIIPIPISQNNRTKIDPLFTE